MVPRRSSRPLCCALCCAVLCLLHAPLPQAGILEDQDGGQGGAGVPEEAVRRAVCSGVCQARAALEQDFSSPALSSLGRIIVPAAELFVLGLVGNREYACLEAEQLLQPQCDMWQAGVSAAHQRLAEAVEHAERVCAQGRGLAEEGGAGGAQEEWEEDSEACAYGEGGEEEELLTAELLDQLNGLRMAEQRAAEATTGQAPLKAAAPASSQQAAPGGSEAGRQQAQVQGAPAVPKLSIRPGLAAPVPALRLPPLPPQPS